MGNIMVKICGLKRAADVDNCMMLGVDILGFVCEYPLPVPWNLSCYDAMQLIGQVKPPHLGCIVTGGSAQKVIALATKLRPSLIQLHYRETLEDTKTIVDALLPYNIGVIKTVPPADHERIRQFGTTDIKTIVEQLCQISIYGLLADSRVPANAATEGSQLDLDFCRQIIRTSTKPVVIAGGITAECAPNIVKQTRAQIIDVMTGVETIPGEKDYQLLSGLMKSIRQL